MRQSDHLEDGRHGLGQLADPKIAAVLADLLDGSNQRAEAGARHVGERPRVDDDGELPAIQDGPERAVEGFDGMGVDEADGHQDGDLFAFAGFDGEFLFQVVVFPGVVNLG